MADKLDLLNPAMPLQERYDKFLLWLSSKNHAVIEFMAQELELSVSEVDVFNELGDLEEVEFQIIDKIGFDIGLLFIVVRAPKDVRKIMYDQHELVLASAQPLSVLKNIVDEHSDYASLEELVKKISGECWKSIASYLKQRNIVSGTITLKIRAMLVGVGNRIIEKNTVSEKQWSWLIRAIEHDHAKSLGIFTNDTIKSKFYEDFEVFTKIHEFIMKYENN